MRQLNGEFLGSREPSPGYLLRSMGKGAATITQVLLFALVGGFLVACSSERSVAGSPTPTDQQNTQSQFCSDLYSLNVAASQVVALGPNSSANNASQTATFVRTSYESLAREALNVPGVQMEPVTSAYNNLVSAAQSLPAPSTIGESAAIVEPPAKDLQAAVVATEGQAKCPIATLPPAFTPVPQPTPNRP